MQTFTAPDPLNGETLRAELAAAGVVVTEPPSLAGDELTLDVTEADRAVVETVLVAHTGTPSPHVANAATIRAQVEAHMTDLAAITGSSGTLTGAQLSNAVRVLARGQRRLIRLAVGLLDGTE